MKSNGKRPQTPLLWDFSVCLYYTIRALTRELTGKRGHQHSGDSPPPRSQQRSDDMEYIQPPLPARGGEGCGNPQQNIPEIIFLVLFLGFFGEMKNQTALLCGLTRLWRKERDSNP